ncbi:FecR domain-containing protein [Sphingomonas psychrotolerans]|uniref:FecR domain-containing protein n=1 Tax=Sphingomonas psychrotolerans TaxID=1327635 RepID=A0ABU3N8M4_9SPHN|nr:FecR domain-containing protein [Sphingomonas psychrotolerans]MDT8760224.1 FecR domain-containing protein [Sphingomonas psychrotolerans]
MSASSDRAMVEQAIAWHLRLKDADENAWIEFAGWLDADPARNDVYEAVADGDARLSPLLASATFPSGEDREQIPRFSNDDDDLAHGGGSERVRRSQWRWGAIAASVAAAGLFGVGMLPSRAARYSIETAAGEIRSVSLADGSEILLNGGTRIVLDRNDTRSVEIARGEARFSVKHDESAPFTVVAGEQRLIDIGTVFNVVRTDRQLRVGVAEGAVRFEATAQAVNLRAGDSLAADDRGKIDMSQRPVASIGSWADGKLVYDQAPLQQVADDLSRSAGISLELPQTLRSRRFSGVIQTYGDRDALRARLEELIGEKIVADGTHWSVKAR